MPDREKVIKGLECCLKESDHLYSNPCNGCPYEGQECIDRMKADALVLLKEQEAIIDQYRRADGFLAAHGWKWEGR